MTRILFVCTGNLCRSPMAQAVVSQLVARAGLAPVVGVDSAGTHTVCEGEAPDPRAISVAAGRSYDLSGLRTRVICDRDFRYFDLLLAMDRQNLALLRRLCPEEHQPKLRLLMEFAVDPAPMEVPDPYYGGTEGFERVLDLCELAGRGLIAALAATGRTSCRDFLQRAS